MILHNSHNIKLSIFQYRVFLNDSLKQRHYVPKSNLLYYKIAEVQNNQMVLVDDDRDYGFPFNKKWTFDHNRIFNNQDFR